MTLFLWSSRRNQFEWFRSKIIYWLVWFRRLVEDISTFLVRCFSHQKSCAPACASDAFRGRCTWCPRPHRSCHTARASGRTPLVSKLKKQKLTSKESEGSFAQSPTVIAQGVGDFELQHYALYHRLRLVARVPSCRASIVVRRGEF